MAIKQIADLRNVKQGAARRRQVQTLADDGAITIVDGVVELTKGTASAITIEDPDTRCDGCTLLVVSTTDAAHTVTYSPTGFNGGGAGEDVATFDATAGCALHLVALGGVWYAISAEPATSPSIA